MSSPVTLQQGANAALQAVAPGMQECLVALAWTPGRPAGVEVDASAFLLKADGKVRSDDDMVFYNNPRSTEGHVEALMDASAAGGQDAKVFAVDIAALADEVEKIAFTVTIHEGVERGQSFASLNEAKIRLVEPGTVKELVSFTLPLEGSKETAMIFGELYRRNGEWKFRAVGQGFHGGLGPLAENFGVDVSAPAPAMDSQNDAVAVPIQGGRAEALAETKPEKADGDVPPERPAAQIVPDEAPEPAKKINLAKVTLVKKGDQVSLKKAEKATGYGQVRINLNWTRSGSSQGILSRLVKRGIDLDIGCLYELKSGRRGIVQALGNAFGSYETPPFIYLAGDDRTGHANHGEDVFINGDKWDDIARVLVFAFIYSGVPNWAKADAKVLVEVPNQGPVEVELDYGDDERTMCGVAMLENVNNSIAVTKLVEYFRGHREMDLTHGFGLTWERGGKD